ncbi:MAG: hypothetical protein R2750_10090 [Bacteroidales bacterium]
MGAVPMCILLIILSLGATFTYYIKEAPKTLRQERREKEKDLFKEKQLIPIPTMDELRLEEAEVKPHLIFTITDEAGNVIRKLSEGISDGIGRLNWDLRFANTRPVSIRDGKYDPTSMGGSFMYVLPGKYFVSISQVVRGEITHLAGPESFHVVPLNNATLPAENREELVAFQKNVNELNRIIGGTESFTEDLLDRVRHIKQAAQRALNTTPELMVMIENVEKQLENILWKFNGQEPRASQEENWPAPPSINDRLGAIVWVHWRSTSGVTQSQRDAFDILKEEFPPMLAEVKTIYETTLPGIEQELETINAPWTPGRIPVWTLD